MDHGGECGFALRVTALSLATARDMTIGKKQKYEFPMYLAAAANLVLRCWLQRRIWFCAMGTTPNLVFRYGPRRQIWHPAVGHMQFFDSVQDLVLYALWAMHQKLVMRLGH